jgi:DNA-binding transcriptional LysR family regulator
MNSIQNHFMNTEALESADLAFLAALAQSQNLVSAAKSLSVSPSAVTQRLQMLERKLGAPLAHRSARQLTLTADALWLTREGVEVLAGLMRLREGLQERQRGTGGAVTVVSGLGFGRRFVAGWLAELRLQHPALKPHLVLSDRIDEALAARRTSGSAAAGLASDWDVTVQVGALNAPDWIAHPLAANARWLCASPDWVVQHGLPQRPSDLEALPCIALHENAEDVTLWRFTATRGRAAQNVRIRPELASNDGEVVKAWGLQGLGAFVRSEWDVADDVAQGRLVRLLPNHKLPDAPVVAYTDARRSQHARVDLVIAALKSRLAKPPWR